MNKKNKFFFNIAKLRCLTILFLCSFIVNVRANDFELKSSRYILGNKGQSIDLKSIFIDIDVRDVSFLDYFNKLKEKSGVNMFLSYAVDDIKQISAITIKSERISVDRALLEVLKPFDLGYSIKNNIISISKISPYRQADDRKEVIGRILNSETNQPMVGVSVFVKETSNGASTDIDGKFKIKCKIGDNIRISYIGMKIKFHKINSYEDMLIYMTPENVGLNDVVVTGFGNKSKASFTGSAIAVSKEELLSVGTTNVLQSLQSFVPGLQILPNNLRGSDPNTLPEIIVRGRSSFEGASNLPTFVVDGAEVDSQYIYDMDINDIESATVLKDASATVLYGAKAANGVIVIKTKKMLGGKIRVSYSGTLKTNIPDLGDYDLLNAEEKLEYERLAHYSKIDNISSYQWQEDEIYWSKYRRVREGVNTDWMSMAVRNSFAHNHNLNIYGGDEYIRYNFGVRYGKDNGVMKSSSRERYGLNFRISYNNGDKVFFQNTLNINSALSEDTPYGSFSSYVNLNPYDRAYNLDGSLNNNLSFNHANPLYEAQLGSYNRGEQYTLYNIFDVQVKILENLKLYGSLSFTKTKNDREIFKSPLSKAFENVPMDEKGSMNISNDKNIAYQSKLYFAYNYLFDFDGLLRLSFGGNLESRNSDINAYTGLGILSDKLDHISFATRYNHGKPTGGANTSRQVGTFITGNFILRDRYFIDASVRYEGSSQFGSETRFAPFWSVGLGWNIHKENFFSNDNINMLKLRTSIGYVGNTSFSPVQSLTTYRYMPTLSYKKGIGAIPITIGNPDLKWERTLNYNIGLDFTFLGGIVDMNIDYYKKITDNLLLDVSKAPSIGVLTAKQNIGEIENSGIDIRLSVIPIRNNDLQWRLSFMGAHNTNKIRKISNALKVMNDKNNNKSSVYPLPVYIEGESISAIKAVPSSGIDPSTGKEVYVKKNGELTFIYDFNDKIVYGDADPELYGSLSSYLTYKGVSLNMIFSYRLGATIYNSTLVTRVEGADYRRNADARVFKSRWHKPGDITSFKDIADSKTPQQSSRFVQSEYRLDMTTLSLGYEFKKDYLKHIGLNQLRLEFLTNNLLNFSNIKQERGLDYPFARSFELSIRATF